MPKLNSALPSEEFIRKNIIHKLFSDNKSDNSAKNQEATTHFYATSVKEFASQLTSIILSVESNKLEKDKAYNLMINVCENIAIEGENLIKSINDKKISNRIKVEFRNILHDLIYERSILMNRALSKPRGYPGDYETIEMNYNDSSLSKDAGEFLDYIFLRNKYAFAVRNRKDKMRLLLAEFIAKSKNKPNIMNIGCGSSREIRELGVNKEIAGFGVGFTCVDYDKDALEFTAKQMELLGNPFKLEYMNVSLLKLIKEPSYQKHLNNKFNMIYSIGLADYFHDNILGDWIRFCYSILPKEGVLIIAHKDRIADERTPVLFDWFVDWKFIPRNEEELTAVIKNSGINNFDVNVEREQSGIIFFLKISKK